MKRARPVDVLALDWNGTVVDDCRRAERATNQVLAELGRRPLDESAFRARFTLPLSSFFAGLGVRDESIAAGIDAWNVAMRTENTRLQPSAVRLLEWARDSEVPVVVISGAAAETVAFDVRELGIADMLSMVVAPAHDKTRELARLRADLGNRVTYVGDTVADIRAANAAGIHSVAYTQGYHDAHMLRAARPAAIVTDLADIPRTIADGHREASTGGKAS